MIVIDKAKLKFLLAGRVLTVQVPARKRPHRARRTYAVSVNGRSSVCRAVVVSTKQTDIGAELQIRQVTEERPHLLAARSEYGYTSDVHKAMRDEPEAVTGPALEQMATAAAARRQVDRADEVRAQRLRSLGQRLRAAAQRREWDQLPDIRREIERVENEAA